MKKLIIILAFLVLNCDPIAYEDDIAFMGSAEANSGEALAKINNQICKDMNGEIGFCFGRILSSQDMKILIPAIPYRYRFYLTCSSEINANDNFDVPKNHEFQYIIPQAKFKDSLRFNCVGDIVKEGSDQILKFFEVRMRVINPKYVKRGKIATEAYEGANYIFFDKHALYGSYKTNLQSGTTSKQPAIELKKGEKLEYAYSCSMLERCNYYGF